MSISFSIEELKHLRHTVNYFYYSTNLPTNELEVERRLDSKLTEIINIMELKDGQD